MSKLLRRQAAGVFFAILLDFVQKYAKTKNILKLLLNYSLKTFSYEKCIFLKKQHPPG